MYIIRLKNTCFTFFLLLVVSSPVLAQVTQKIGSNPGTINVNAALEIESTTKGFLPPRMTKVQRDAITTPAAGLMVWCTDCGASGSASPELNVHNGTIWIALGGVVAIKPTLTPLSGSYAPKYASATSITLKGKTTTSLNATLTKNGFYYKVYVNSTTEAPNETDLFIAGTVNPAALGTDFTATLTGLLATKSYFISAASLNAAGETQSTPAVISTGVPVFTTPIANNTTLYTTVINSAGTATMSLLAGANCTEYGYYYGTTNPPTTNKTVLAGIDTITTNNATANQAIALPATTLTLPTIAPYYFKYYGISNGVETPSPVVSFTPLFEVSSGGRAVVSGYEIGTQEGGGSLYTKSAVSGTFTQAIVATATTAGNFNLSFPMVNGISFSAISGSFNAGANAITLVGSGTPTAAGTFTIESTTTPKISFTFLVKKGNYIADCTATGIATMIFNNVVSSSTSKIWMDRNLGAINTATSTNDIEAYGCYYQWSRGNDGHANTGWNSLTGLPFNPGISGTAPVMPLANAQTSYNPGSYFIQCSSGSWLSTTNNLWQNISGVNNPCPSGYRVPTDTELANELTTYSSAEVIKSFAGTSTDTRVGLKFVLAGKVNFVGTNTNQGIMGFYWSSTIVSPYAGAYFPAYAYVNGEIKGSSVDYPANGMSVRCIKN